MPVEFRGKKWRRYALTALALAAFAGPGRAASEPGVNFVQHELKLFDPLTDAILNGEKHVRKKAGKLLAEGNCAEAKKYALRKGRFDVASAIDRQCNPAGHSASGSGLASAPPPVGWRP